MCSDYLPHTICIEAARFPAASTRVSADGYPISAPQRDGAIMELNRNQYFFIGLVVLLIGLQFAVSS